MREFRIYCPVNGWDCPYWYLGECAIENPIEDCDDFGVFWDADDDYMVTEEKRRFFDEEDNIDNGDDIYVCEIDSLGNNWW